MTKTETALSSSTNFSRSRASNERAACIDDENDDYSETERSLIDKVANPNRQCEMLSTGNQLPSDYALRNQSIIN